MLALTTLHKKDYANISNISWSFMGCYWNIHKKIHGFRNEQYNSDIIKSKYSLNHNDNICFVNITT